MPKKTQCPEFPYFGAIYPDACCIDGYLWDLDSCDSPGSNLLTSGGDDPCPFCNYDEAIARCADALWDDGEWTRKSADKEARRRIRAFQAKHR